MGSSFAPESIDVDGLVVKCSFPNCTAESSGDGAVCYSHLMQLTGKQPSASCPTTHQPTTFQTTKERLAPDSDPGSVLSILGKKTAASNGSFWQPSSTSVRPTVPAQGVAGLPGVHSASGRNRDDVPIMSLSTPPRDVEPERKRMRLDPTVERRPEIERSGPFGIATFESATMDKPPRSMPTHNRSSPISPQPSKYGHKIEAVGKGSTKRLSRPGVVRKMALDHSQEPLIPIKPEKKQATPKQVSSGGHTDSEEYQSSRNATNENRGSRDGSHSSLVRDGDRDRGSSRGFDGNKALQAWFSKSHSQQYQIYQEMLNGKGKQRAPSRPASLVNGNSEHRDGPGNVPAHVPVPSITNPAKQQKTIPLPSTRKPPTPKAPVAHRPVAKQTEEPAPGRPPEKPGSSPRQSSDKRDNASEFDAWIYSQPAASEPPPGVRPTARPDQPSKPRPPDEPYYAHIDPRLHWPQPHSERWFGAKQEEIRSRGGRKANFGKATQRMKEQRVREGPASFEAQLPDRILQDPSWLRALKSFHGVGDKRPPQQPERRTTKQSLRRHPSANGAGFSRRLAS